MSGRHNLVTIGLVSGFLLGLIGGSISGARADKHPHYLQALADLRYARSFLTVTGKNNVMAQEQEALMNIGKAIDDLKDANIDDGKSIDTHPPVDSRLKHKGRLQKVIALLNSAHRNLMTEKDNKVGMEWRSRAIKHVDAALMADKQAIIDVHDDK